MNEADKCKKIQLLAKLNKFDDINTFFNSIKKPSEIIQLEYFDCTKQQNKVVEYYRQKIDKGEILSLQDIISYSYSLLNLKEYETCYDFLSKYYSKPETCEAAIIVNYLMAKKFKTGKNTPVDSEVRKKIIDNSYIKYGDEVLAAGYALISDKKNTIKHIKLKLSKDPDFLYYCYLWPVFSVVLEKSDYNELDKYVDKMNLNLN